MKLPPNLSYNTVMEAAKDCMFGSGEYLGFCLSCGAEVSGVEPDAEDYPCPFCGVENVYGAEQIILYVTS